LKYRRRVQTANPIYPFAIEYIAYSMIGAAVIVAKGVIKSLLNRSILWPHGEQRERK